MDFFGLPRNTNDACLVFLFRIISSFSTIQCIDATLSEQQLSIAFEMYTKFKDLVDFFLVFGIFLFLKFEIFPKIYLFFFCNLSFCAANSC